MPGYVVAATGLAGLVAAIVVIGCFDSMAYVVDSIEVSGVLGRLHSSAGSCCIRNLADCWGVAVVFAVSAALYSKVRPGCFRVSWQVPPLPCLISPVVEGVNSVMMFAAVFPHKYLLFCERSWPLR